MNITTIKVGKIKNKPIEALANHYIKRITPYSVLQSYVLASDDKLIQWLEKLRGHDILIALDEKGEHLSSQDLSQHLAKWLGVGAIKSLVFLIGGPYGIPYQRLSNQPLLRWSLSRATFPSDLAYVLVLEQLYRCMTILQGHPYHHV